MERPSHATVKLWNVEDTTLLDNMKNAHELATRLLDKERLNDSSEKFDDIEEKGGGAKDDLGDGDHDDVSAENGLFNFRLDKKFMNEQEESARYYIQSMNKFHVNSGNAASWETFPKLVQALGLELKLSTFWKI